MMSLLAAIITGIIRAERNRLAQRCTRRHR